MIFTQSKREEIFNSITHGIGALLSIAALVLLIVFAAIKGTAWHVVSFSVFGSTLILLYLSSTLYHSLSHWSAKRLFNKFDHIAIFLLIAGTYTPFCLVPLNGWIGWTLLGVVWTCAIIGVVMKAFHTGKKQFLSTMLYIAMGWVVVLAINPLYQTVSTASFIFLISGGLFYSVGTIFFLNDRIKYFHSIWHLFVLGGSIFHFFSVMDLLA